MRMCVSTETVGRRHGKDNRCGALTFDGGGGQRSGQSSCQHLVYTNAVVLFVLGSGANMKGFSGGGGGELWN